MRLPRLGRPLGALLLLGALALLLAGCDVDVPQNTFNPEGEVAKDQRDLFYLAMWPAIVVMILVEVGIVLMLIRFRRREGDRVPKQTHGNMPLEITWTIIPTIVIIVFVGIPMLPILFKLGDDPEPGSVPINVTGQRFVWEFGYPEFGEDEEGNPLVTSLTEVHIPVEKEIALTITSIDVIHSFAVPRIAGTLDAIPGHDSTMWIKVDTPGSYAGQCREFCGLDHATMLITLIAQSEEDYRAWGNEMLMGQKSGDTADAVSAEANGE